MESLNRLLKIIFGKKLIDFSFSKHYAVTKEEIHILSRHLRRDLIIYVYRPASCKGRALPLLLFNDGQDMPALRLASTLEQLIGSRQIPPLIVAAIPAGDRMQEYGTTSSPDYLQRGAKADAYARFVVEELLPHLRSHYPCTQQAVHTAFAGCSLGGLSAFDIAWHYPKLFGTVGVFSGSFWWRNQAYRSDAPDANRIVHHTIEKAEQPLPALRFWFQTGTEDETNDRNNNGVIDSIDDTLDLIDILQELGYRPGKDIRYVEIQGGRHHPDTWAEALPDFLCFAFGQKDKKRATALTSK